MTGLNNEFWGKCVSCGYVFKLADLPMELGEFGRALKKAKCPKCAANSKQIRVLMAAEVDAVRGQGGLDETKEQPRETFEDDEPRVPVVHNPPKRIWLNVGEIEEDTQFSEFIDNAWEVTWCRDKQYDGDVEYVLASELAAANKEAGRLLKAARKAVLALAHADESKPGLYRDAYEALSAAIDAAKEKPNG